MINLKKHQVPRLYNIVKLSIKFFVYYNLKKDNNYLIWLYLFVQVIKYFNDILWAI